MDPLGRGVHHTPPESAYNIYLSPGVLRGSPILRNRQIPAGSGALIGCKVIGYGFRFRGSRYISYRCVYLYKFCINPRGMLVTDSVGGNEDPYIPHVDEVYIYEHYRRNSPERAPYVCI